MLLLDPTDTGFREFIRTELALSEKARFSSCERFQGTEIGKTCIGTVNDRDLTWVLLKGTFTISGDTMILDLNFPGSPDPNIARKELIASGFAPESTRFVGICTNVRAGKPEAGGEPEIQVVLIPY
jgi:hypothetical protein